MGSSALQMHEEPTGDVETELEQGKLDTDEAGLPTHAIKLEEYMHEIYELKNLGSGFAERVREGGDEGNAAYGHAQLKQIMDKIEQTLKPIQEIEAEGLPIPGNIMLGVRYEMNKEIMNLGDVAYAYARKLV